MIKKLHLKSLLLLCALIFGIGSAWADTVTNIATATFNGKNATYTTGWSTTGTGVGRTDCVIIGSGENITSPAFDLSGYDEVTISIKARRFGTLSGSKATIDASIGGTSVGTTDASGTNATTSLTDITFTPTSSMTAVNLVFTCTNATSPGSTHGAGINTITITGTKTTNAVLTGITLSGDYETTFSLNGSFSYQGLIVTASYDDGTSGSVTGFTVSSPDMTTLGTQTVTVSYTDNGVTKTATYDITVEEVQDYARLPFNWGGGSSADLLNLDGVTANSLGSDYGSSHTLYLVKFDGTGDYIQVKTDSQPGKVTVGVKMIGGATTSSITVQGSADGSTFTDVETLTISGKQNDILTLETTNTFAATDRYVRLYFNKGSNVGIGPITIAVPSTDPEISANATLSLAYDATSGEIGYSIVNPVDGASLTATSEADWISNFVVAADKVTFTTSENAGAERTATVTLTYSTATKDVTVTQAAAPVSYSTIPAIFAAATSTATDVNVTFGNWVVSGVSTNGKNVFVTDGTNGFVIFDNNGGLSDTYTVGDILSGTAVSCKLVLYNGFAEITNLDTSALNIGTGGTVSAANIALDELAGVNTGALVSYENLTCSVDNNKYYLSDGTTTLQVYNALYAFGTLEDGKTYNITGIYQQYNNTKEILPRSADDIEEVAAPAMEYTLTVTASDNVEIFTFVGDTSNEGVEGATTLQVSNGTEVGLSVSATQGYELKLSVDGIDVTSLLDDTGFYTFTMPTHNVTVSATAVAPDVPVDPAVAGVGAFVKVTDAADITSGNYLIVYEAGNIAFKGSLETLDAVGNTIDVTIVGDKIPATATTVASTFTIQPNSGTLQSASGKYVYIDSYSNGLKQSDDKPSLANSFDINDGNALITVETSGGKMTMKYNSASNQDRFRYYKSGQNDIQLYKYVATEQAIESISITVSSAGYATYCSADALDFSNTGLTAYRATISSDNQVNFIEVTEVPAKEGVLLKGAANTYDVPIIASAEPIENDLIGVTKNTKVEETGIFVLLNGDYGVGFYKTTASSFTVGAHTAYFPALPSGARNFIAIDEATAIKAIESKQQSGEIYNLAGQRVKSAQKGLYIINGKKVVIK